MDRESKVGPAIREVAGNLAGPFLLFVVLLALFAGAGLGVKGGIFPTSEGNATPHQAPGVFVLAVSESGETVFKSAKGVSDAVRQKLLDTAYPSPEAAEDAATRPQRIPWWWSYQALGAKPAHAHAVKICTHQDGVVSNNTGAGRHLTNFRFHESGRHYTVTYHQVFTQSGWVTYDTFKYSVARSYCGC